MTYGRLSAKVLTEQVDDVVYTVPENCLYAVIDVNIVNDAAESSEVNVAISQSNTVSATDYIEKGVELTANGGVYMRTDLKVSAGERIIINNSKSGAVVRVSGLLITSV